MMRGSITKTAEGKKLQGKECDMLAACGAPGEKEIHGTQKQRLRLIGAVV